MDRDGKKKQVVYGMRVTFYEFSLSVNEKKKKKGLDTILIAQTSSSHKNAEKDAAGTRSSGAEAKEFRKNRQGGYYDPGRGRSGSGQPRLFKVLYIYTNKRVTKSFGC